MKKSLISTALLHAAAAMAATDQNAHAKDRVISPKAENDDALTLKSTETIVTREMQADKKTRYIKKISGRGDVRPIHIGTEWASPRDTSLGDITKMGPQWPSTGASSIPTLWRSAQFGGQHHVAGAFGNA